MISKISHIFQIFQFNSDIILHQSGLCRKDTLFSYVKRKKEYCRILNISPGLINVCKHFFQRGLYFFGGGLIFRGGLYSDGIVCWCLSIKTLKFIIIYRHYSKKGVSLGQNHLYFALKSMYIHPNIF